MNTTPEPAEASSTSTQLGQQVGTILPDLIEVAGEDLELEIKTASEGTCLAPEDDAPQTNTAWMGIASGPVDDASTAHAALDRLDQHLRADGWEKQNEVDDQAAGTRALFFLKGDLGATIRLNKTPNTKSVKIIIDTPCTDQPVEHRMQRLEIDPDYGKNTHYYDDWK